MKKIICLQGGIYVPLQQNTKMQLFKANIWNDVNENIFHNKEISTPE